MKAPANLNKNVSDPKDHSANSPIGLQRKECRERNRKVGAAEEGMRGLSAAYETAKLSKEEEVRVLGKHKARLHRLQQSLLLRYKQGTTTLSHVATATATEKTSNKDGSERPPPVPRMSPADSPIDRIDTRYGAMEKAALHPGSRAGC